MPAQFSVPDVEDNVEGWGPTSVPDHLSGVPYAPFGKGDRVGKISDFTQAGGKYGGAAREFARYSSCLFCCVFLLTRLQAYVFHLLIVYHLDRRKIWTAAAGRHSSLELLSY